MNDVPHGSGTYQEQDTTSVARTANAGAAGSVATRGGTAPVLHRTTRTGKFAELFVLGLMVGAISFALSFLWKSYIDWASDLTQRLAVEVVPPELSFPLVFVDIGEPTCEAWAREFGGLCARLPRFPRSELAKLFDGLVDTKPKLVVVDIDLQPENNPTSNPYELPDGLSVGDRSIQNSVRKMADTPFAVARPLIRKLKPNSSQEFDYLAMPTILDPAAADRSNIKFGHVQQNIDADGIIRRFPATVKALHAGEPIPHLALQVCDLIRSRNLCGNGRTNHSHVAPGPSNPHQHSFGKLAVTDGELVRFRYSFLYDVNQPSANINIKRIEARTIATKSHDPKVFNDAVVIIGSSAVGRNDYHVTPFNVFGGETAGMAVLANEVVAALLDAGLKLPSLGWRLLEKFTLVLISSLIVFFAFWYPVLRERPVKSDEAETRMIGNGSAPGLLGVVKYTGRAAEYVGTAAWFCAIVAVVFLVNVFLLSRVSLRALSHGELADPITPVVAVVLDALVDVSTVVGSQVAGIGSQVAAWAGRRLRAALRWNP